MSARLLSAPLPGRLLLGAILVLGLVPLAVSCGGGGNSNPAPTVTAPSITTQPQSLTKLRGETAVFTVAATGSPAPTFQWRKDGSPLSGQTGATLTLTNVQPADEGSYVAVATNSGGSASSSPAVLTVNTPPTFTTQPQSATVVAPGTASFTVAVSGKPAPSLQWQLATDGGAPSQGFAQAMTWQDIPGATTMTYTTGATHVGMHGYRYRCVATNSVGSAPSNPAVLSIDTPTFTLTVNRGTGVDGTPATTASYPAGTVVDYAYTAAAGYSNLQVTLDGTPAATSGTVTMGANHTLAATATSAAAYTVTFVAGANGTLTGTALQNVPPGGNTTAVTAVPNAGFRFANWTGAGFAASTANPLTVTNVQQNLTITANFQAAPPVGCEVGNTAIDVSGTSWDGLMVTMSQHRGKVILLDFSAGWCGPCKTEAGHLEALYQEFKNKGFIVITVLIQGAGGAPATQADLLAWKNTYGLTIPVIMDPGYVATNAYQVEYIPHNVIIDKDFVINSIVVGADMETMRNAIATLLP